MTVVTNRTFNEIGIIQSITDISEIRLKTTDDKYYPTGKWSYLDQKTRDRYFLGNQAWIVPCQKNEDEEFIMPFVLVVCRKDDKNFVYVSHLGQGYSKTNISEESYVYFLQGMGVPAKKLEKKVIEKIISLIHNEFPSYAAEDTRRKIVDSYAQRMGQKKKAQIMQYQEQMMITPKEPKNYYMDIAITTDKINTNGNPIKIFMEIELSDIRYENHEKDFKIKIMKAALTRQEVWFVIADEHYYKYLELIEEFYLERPDNFPHDKWKICRLGEFMENGSSALTKI